MPVGVDNGLKGALVHITDSGLIDDQLVMPVIKENGKNVVDVRSLFKWLKQYQDDVLYIENFQAGPQLTPSTFRSLADSYSRVWTTASLLGMRRKSVMPQEWQRDFWDYEKGLDTKEKSFQLARKRWPEHDWRATARSTKPHDGLTDASHIAEYGRRQSISGLLPPTEAEEFEMEFVRTWNAKITGTGIKAIRGTIPKTHRKNWEKRLNSVLDDGTTWRSRALEGIDAMVEDDHCLNKTGNNWYANIAYFVTVNALNKLLDRAEKKRQLKEKVLAEEQRKEDEGNW